MDLAVVLRDRFPTVAALFLAGELNARRVWLIANRTYLVTSPAAVAALDRVIAERITAWGPLTEDKLTQAIDVWVDRIDPAAVRRTRTSARARDFTVADTDATGTAAVFGRLLGPDAVLLKQRVAAMARGVCEDDPRTLAQRRSDALRRAGARAPRCCPVRVPTRTAPPSSTTAGPAASSCTSSPTADHRGPARSAPARRRTGARRARPPATTADGRLSLPLRRQAGLLFGGGILPAPLLAELIARGAKVTLVGSPDSRPNRGTGRRPRWTSSSATAT